MEEEKYDYGVKLFMVGESGSGKRQLLLRWAGADVNLHDYITTIGVDFRVKRMEVNTRPCKLLVWDSAGQERFRTITTGMYRGAHGLMMVYDITDEHTFLGLRARLTDLAANSKSHNLNVVLCGTNLENEGQRVVTHEQGAELCDEFKLDGFVEVNVQQDVNVEEAFLSLASAVVTRFTHGLTSEQMSAIDERRKRIRTRAAEVVDEHLTAHLYIDCLVDLCLAYVGHDVLVPTPEYNQEGAVSAGAGDVAVQRTSAPAPSTRGSKPSCSLQ